MWVNSPPYFDEMWVEGRRQPHASDGAECRHVLKVSYVCLVVVSRQCKVKGAEVLHTRQPAI
jgi:hypothetical protein